MGVMAQDIQIVPATILVALVVGRILEVVLLLDEIQQVRNCTSAPQGLAGRVAEQMMVVAVVPGKVG
jgi:hypothetical protein